MKLKATDLFVNGANLHCHEISKVTRLPEQPKMVEVTIQCTISEQDLNELLEREGY